MDRIWLKHYPPGVPADIDPSQYRSIVALMDESFAKFRAAFVSGLWIFPGWFIKLVALALIWAYLHHFIAGLRHLWMDVSHAAVTKEFGAKSAVFTLTASGLLTAILGLKLFGIF